MSHLHFVITLIHVLYASPKMLTNSSPSVTVTLDELARAIENIGLPVSAELLYQEILQIQAPPSPNAPQPPITPAQRKSQFTMTLCANIDYYNVNFRGHWHGAF